jgi:hypothetical protein
MGEVQASHSNEPRGQSGFGGVPEKPNFEEGALVKLPPEGPTPLLQLIVRRRTVWAASMLTQLPRAVQAVSPLDIERVFD